MNNQSLPAHLRKSILDYIADFLFDVGSLIVAIVMTVAFALFNPKLAYITARNSVTPGRPFTTQSYIVFLICTLTSSYVLMGVSRCFSFIINGAQPTHHAMWLDWWWVIISKVFA